MMGESSLQVLQEAERWERAGKGYKHTVDSDWLALQQMVHESTHIMLKKTNKSKNSEYLSLKLFRPKEA